MQANAEYSPKKLNTYINTMNRNIGKAKDKSAKLKLLASLKNKINNTTTTSKGKKYSNLSLLQQAYVALDTQLISQGKCELIRADLQFRFHPSGFEKGKIYSQVMKALQTLKVFCPNLKIYQ
tara:strand:- start:161 stop:526 length:366 start_codon:yes stop_codon:yes gene_type:complete